MPRHSPFSIRLTSEEREELQSRVRKYTSPYCDIIRAKIVLLAAEGPCNDIIVDLNVPCNTIVWHVHRTERHGPQHLKNVKRILGGKTTAKRIEKGTATVQAG